MIWNKHYRDVPEGAHAFLGASKYYWLNYDDDKLINVYKNQMAAMRGTKLHAFAKTCIDLGQKLPKNKKTLNCFVNDAIGFKMEAEQPLFYSENCFGTADAISFKNDFLRIHDLKTGVQPASMHQLEIYMALFCLEYGFIPKNISSELRIYQNDEVIIGSPEPGLISDICDQIRHFDEVIEKIKAGEI